MTCLGSFRVRLSHWDSYLWSIYFQFTFTTIVHSFNKHLLDAYNVLSTSAAHDALFRTQSSEHSLHTHDLTEAFCCWEKNIRYSCSMFEVRSMFLLENNCLKGTCSSTARQILIVLLNCTLGVQAIVGYGTLGGGDGGGSCIQWWKESFDLSTVSF